ncbi:P-loop containing nucleoside triphosphate hydrolase protein [Mytilinidion resinicola]|uniref:P-loop containing nucleoside triphosphate hydrolase protein n=1 Tax=Mytilinidion resinicola TaxID=574789 RepID=A0A6A6YLZ9_9PEZI|nr:P-loop containing nucleoside triphosphate hydrolase protein [Mytilinidion resinicola]KAF2809820.1 P-loop containing nucleoside triphosphate hydrolase protein [Mytilinidion resinicola]
MTLGLSLTPLRSFLHECKKQHEASIRNTTIFYDRAEMSTSWGVPRERPGRPLSTIDLDEKLKTALVADITEYLHPHRAKWYSDRGIPYSRGYLFHGQPGVGKTSMAKGLASYFHLPLFSTSLSRNMNEHTLDTLFRQLPKRCIILLEDIDSAGIQREEMKEANAEQPNPWTQALGRAGISLSCLLNVIDGPNSGEGRVLIMTTNTPESLDRALIRPGRIDMQVFFGPVSRKVTASIFKRMYMIETPANGVTVNEQTTELDEQAEAFSSHIPELKFTPAEVQTFLTMNRTPEQAIAAAKDWADNLLVSKEKGLNVITGETDTPGHVSFDGSETDGPETDDSNTDVSDNEETHKNEDSEPDMRALLSSAFQPSMLEQRVPPPAPSSTCSDETMVDEEW